MPSTKNKKDKLADDFNRVEELTDAKPSEDQSSSTPDPPTQSEEEPTMAKTTEAKMKTKVDIINGQPGRTNIRYYKYVEGVRVGYRLTLLPGQCVKDGNYEKAVLASPHFLDLKDRGHVVLAERQVPAVK